jgi:signal transduction histidine kinase
MTAARKVLLLAAVWSVLGALFATQAFISSHYATKPLSWSQSFNVALTAWYVRGVLAAGAYWLATRVPFTRSGVVRASVVHIPASIIYAVAAQTLFTEIIKRLPATASVLPSPAEAQISLVVYWIVLGTAHAIRYYARGRDAELATVRLQSQLASARLDVLRGQLHPHFLFNTLNDIAELIHEDPDRADEMLTTVSELLRASLARSDQREVSLDDEVAFLGRYLEIARMRFRDRLTIDVDIPEALGRMQVPSLILQPVVENAIRHGVARRDGGGRVRISAVRDGSVLRLEVCDNGPGLDEARGEGIGLRTTRVRLREQFGNAATFDLAAADGGGAVARIAIPIGVA